jgi:hypothetical protein
VAKQKKKVLSTAKEKLLDDVKAIFMSHNLAVKEILENELVDSEIIGLAQQESAETLDAIVGYVAKAVPDEDLDLALKILKKLKEDKYRFGDKLTEFCDKDAMVSELKYTEYAVIKINNDADRAALEDFVNTKIYPHYSDQQKNVFI